MNIETWQEYQKTKSPVLLNRIIQDEMPLVRWCIKKFLGSNVQDYEDLLQEGAIGLFRALQSWDPEKGEWGGYAPFWIRHYIQKASQNIPLVWKGTTIFEETVINGRVVEPVAEKAALLKEVWDYVDTLPPEQCETMRKLHKDGLYAMEIEESAGVSRWRRRRIEEKAMRSLRRKFA
jgi:RNA polymerase sigma factor (sigma-70 family)